MTQLSAVVFRNRYKSGIDSVTGEASSEVEFIDVGAVFDTENGGVVYIQNKFKPEWDSNASGSLPDYFLIKSEEAERIYKIADGESPSIYKTLWSNV